ncbi:hypothetical protein QO011_007235 [Labrys wisconsinensis]|uniref:Transposase n=1 Tax=Labrys wisconsinensis TaxID=425677 RepID=A0ABU0JKS2_9HYPH|nr:hypothetical protein [Labrys wisconsinensis]
MARRREPVIPDAILDQLLAGVDAKARSSRRRGIKTPLRT